MHKQHALSFEKYPSEKIKMNTRLFVVALLSATLACSGFAQLKKLAIVDVKAGSGLMKAATKNDTTNSLERVVQAFDSQLTDRMHGTRKFDIIVRSDLNQLVTDAIARGAGFKIPNADYVLVTTLDDFQDYQENLTLQTTGEKLSKRIIRVTAVAKIYDAQSGKLFESANVTRSIPDAGAQFASVKNGDLSDSLLVAVAADIADATANRVSDVIYPAKVISKLDKQVTINRGDGTAIATGQVWQVYALGAELKDPDTQEVIDHERLLVGKIRIVRVNPKTTLAEIVEDSGITVGAIVQPLK
jgi:hypothetical protein